MTPRAVLSILLPVSLGLGWLLVSWVDQGAVPPPEGHGELLRISAPAPSVRVNEPLAPLPQIDRLDPEKVALGRQLFHDARLSADQSISCATCHPLDQGGADKRPVSLGVNNARGEINAPSVLTAALNFRQFWDGRAATLEEQAAGPVTNPREMAASWLQVLERLGRDPALKQKFARLYPDGITPQNITRAIADFERSLLRPSRFDRWLQGEHNAISSDEQSGYQLFKKHGCIGCHQGANVGGNLFQRFGVMENYFADKPSISHADLGRFNITGKEEDRHVFKVPSLRNVALTAPYFHDASTNKLAEAVATMGRYQLGVELTPRDITLITAFLDTLTSERMP